jgi:hypothetical protein
MAKSWLIKASAPFCGTDTYYCAFSEEDPLNCDDFPYEEIIEELWDDYSYLLHLEDDDYDSEVEYQEAYDQAYEQWHEDCDFDSEEISLEEIQDYLPSGVKLEDYIIYNNGV